MVASEVRPGRNPPFQHNLSQVSDRTRITRRFFADHAIICKHPLGPDAEHRVRHETTMLQQRLRGVNGSPNWLKPRRNRGRFCCRTPALRTSQSAPSRGTRMR